MGRPYSLLALLIIAVSKKDQAQIIKILKEETKNTAGKYYSGLELRRMDGRYISVEILKEIMI